MTFLHNLVHDPRKLFLRRAVFQIHLWAGIIVSVYVVIIAVSGAILVFEDELTSTTLPAGLSKLTATHMASIPDVMQQFLHYYPGASVSEIDTPWPTIPAYRLHAVSATGHKFNLVADPVTASLHSQPETWVTWVHDLHVYLLLGNTYGEQINAVGAAILLLLSVTGLLLWWQGLKNWTRALLIDLNRNWRRINFDAHHAIGVWTLAIVVWWSISGIYFGCYKQFVSVVNAISPLQGMVSPPLSQTLSSGTRRATLRAILAAAQQASPRGRLFGLSDPSLRGALVYAQMDLRDPGDFSHRDILAIDATNAQVLTIWHYGQNHSAGDWFMWSMHPLHFGTLWGLEIKIGWFFLGISLSILSATGVIMYWNRYLRDRF
ncbi:MAG: PepSY-associated TM helix domain-containing protein [Terracidiphilus sp.]